MKKTNQNYRMPGGALFLEDWRDCNKPVRLYQVAPKRRRDKKTPMRLFNWADWRFDEGAAFGAPVQM